MMMMMMMMMMMQLASSRPTESQMRDRVTNVDRLVGFGGAVPLVEQHADVLGEHVLVALEDAKVEGRRDHAALALPLVAGGSQEPDTEPRTSELIQGRWCRVMH